LDCAEISKAFELIEGLFFFYLNLYCTLVPMIQRSFS